MKRFTSTKALGLVAAAFVAAAITIAFVANPAQITWSYVQEAATLFNTSQINWAAQTGCGTATYPWVPADSQCEAPGGGGGGASNLFIYEQNDSSGGTALNYSVCWSQTTFAQQLVVKCPSSASNGTDNNVPFLGVCVSGCGTSGYAKIQYAGEVSWICDGTVTSISGGGYWVQPSTSTSGECHQPTGSYPPSPNENANGNTIIGFPDTGNSGSGTAATVNLYPFPYYVSINGAGQNALLMSIGSGSPYDSYSQWYQNPSSSAIAYALGGNGFYINEGSGDYAAFGYEPGLGTSGHDLIFDLLTNGYGLPPTAMLQFKGSTMNQPDVRGSVSGTVAVGISGQLCVGNTGGNFIWTLAGNTTTYSPTCENPGHVEYWTIEPPASGGPYTFTWPSGFVGMPIISLLSSSPAVATACVWDGTNCNHLQ
jgi:hypothetical protein